MQLQQTIATIAPRKQTDDIASASQILTFVM